MKTVQINVFDFNELNEKAKSKARDKVEILLSDDVNFILFELFVDKLKENGFHFEDFQKAIHYSLDSCQGDGVAFYGEVDSELLLQHLNKDFNSPECIAALVNFPEVFTTTIEIQNKNSGYNHANSMYVNVNIEPDSDLIDYVDVDRKIDCECEIENYIGKLVIDLSNKMEEEGYVLIRSMRDDSYIAEYCKEKCIMFYANGSIYDGEL